MGGAVDGQVGRRLLAAVGVVALLAVGGCGALGDDRSSKDSADTAPQRAAPQEGKDTNGAKPGTDGPKAGAGGGAPDLRVDQKSIVYTGSMQVRVDEVDAAARSAVTVATTAGGFVGGDERRSTGDNAWAKLELRVPAARFNPVLDELAKLGQEVSRSISAEDVTEQAVDLDARIATQRARVESGRKLLARANSIDDLVSLESEVARREADLASLEAKKRRLADLTALSTITLNLVGKDARPSDEESEAGFLTGLEGGWKAFTASVTVLLTVLGVLLPWAVALGAPVALLVLLLRRRRRQRRPAPAATFSEPPRVPAARSEP
ncbi:DUF4349 domain-containing protein [Micromonospora sp. DT233]|uniref:DUF4349 domain-containing protein n=1 Tax=Micromonospora sp. DT233 TaxID=3393432 RepID=UPI003CEB72DB